MAEDERMVAFNARMEEKRKRQAAAELPEETPEALGQAYLKRTKRDRMSAEGGKGTKTVVSITTGKR